MPIHDQGYRRYAGTRARAGRAWSVIAKAGVRTLFARRAFIGLLLLSWVPFVVRAVQLYAATNLPQAQFLAPDARMFRQFLEQQEILLFFITVYAGTGLIANDRRANALQIYLSKPLTRVEYIFGKFAILFTLLLLVTWVPAVLLVLIQVMFSGSFTFVLNNLFLLPAITIFSLVQVVSVALAMLALSSLSQEQPLRRRAVCRAHLLLAGDLRCRARHDPRLDARVAVHPARPAADRRRGVQARTAIQHAGAGARS